MHQCHRKGRDVPNIGHWRGRLRSEQATTSVEGEARELMNQQLLGIDAPVLSRPRFGQPSVDLAKRLTNRHHCAHQGACLAISLSDVSGSHVLPGLLKIMASPYLCVRLNGLAGRGCVAGSMLVLSATYRRRCRSWYCCQRGKMTMAEDHKRETSSSM